MPTTSCTADWKVNLILLPTHLSESAGSRMMQRFRLSLSLKASGLVTRGPTELMVTRTTEPRMHTWLSRSRSSRILLPSSTTVCCQGREEWEGGLHIGSWMHLGEKKDRKKEKCERIKWENTAVGLKFMDSLETWREREEWADGPREETNDFKYEAEAVILALLTVIK